jgi:hypothetical protein
LPLEFTTSLLGMSSASFVKQDAPHRLRRSCEEVGAIGSVCHRVAIEEPQENFIHQRGRLKRQITLHPHQSIGVTLNLVVDQIRSFLPSFRLPLTRFPDELSKVLV